ncbi:unnamed protein product [Lepidochelys kempii]
MTGRGMLLFNFPHNKVAHNETKKYPLCITVVCYSCSVYIRYNGAKLMGLSVLNFLAPLFKILILDVGWSFSTFNFPVSFFLPFSLPSPPPPSPAEAQHQLQGRQPNREQNALNDRRKQQDHWLTAPWGRSWDWLSAPSSLSPEQRLQSDLPSRVSCRWVHRSGWSHTGMAERRGC